MRIGAGFIWGGLVLGALVPVAMAVASPLLAWRDEIYIAAGFAGILALALLLFQPLLAVGALPGVSARSSRRVHRLLGVCLLVLVVAHVLGLWVTSPPDVIDALLFDSPTPFSLWGVLAMWGVLALDFMTAFRRYLRLHAHNWRRLHQYLALWVVLGTALHAWLIQGAMEVFSKAVLCLSALSAVLYALWLKRRKRHGG